MPSLGAGLRGTAAMLRAQGERTDTQHTMPRMRARTRGHHSARASRMRIPARSTLQLPVRYGSSEIAASEFQTHLAVAEEHDAGQEHHVTEALCHLHIARHIHLREAPCWSQKGRRKCRLTATGRRLRGLQGSHARRGRTAPGPNTRQPWHSPSPPLLLRLKGKYRCGQRLARA